MPEFKAEQLAAVNARGKTIVSASAGSGKTTVMIEKIVRLILSGVSVDGILAVTYTKKAAAQMKEKLRGAIIKKINERGTDKDTRTFLKAQLNGVQAADISTVHSFCAKLIRQNFFEAETTNTFAVISMKDADGTELLSRAMDDIFAVGYEQADEDFLHLLSVYFKKKKDTQLRNLLVDCYETLRSRDDYLVRLQTSGGDDVSLFDGVTKGLLDDLQARCRYYMQVLDRESAFFSGREKCEQSRKLIDALTVFLQTLLAADDYFLACRGAEGKFPSSQSVRDNTPADIANHIARVKVVAADVKELQKQLVSTADREEEYTRFRTSMRTARAVAKYLLLLDERYAQLKREKDVLDYNDLEHVALRLLSDADRQAAMRKKYRYVFVDEYQDVNPVQEKIIGAVSGENLFLVGDVKQSIYGFRGSKSQFFVDKQALYRKEGHNALTLPQNFRSAPAILDAVNAQFSAMMTKGNSSVDYAEEGVMQTGGLYVAHDGSVAQGRVRVHICGKDEKVAKGPPRGVYSVREGSRERQKTYSAQVREVVRLIRREKLYGQWYDVESGQFRKVDYGDIAILYRGGGKEIDDLSSALAEADVPVSGGSSVNVCDYPEIKTLIDLLSLIDNERQDIPLCSALLAVADCSSQDLAQIRLWEKDVAEKKGVQQGSFYAACQGYAQSQTDALAHRLRNFSERLKTWRLLAQVTSAGELLTGLIAEMGLEKKFLSRRSGDGCLQRIHRFLEETSNPTPMSVREFLDRLNGLGYQINCPVGGGENAVKMMTMHSSKGLEFPVVFLVELGKRLHGMDESKVVVEEEYGLAPFAYDEKNRIEQDTLLRRLYRNKGNREETKDELNVYYVAATRAKYAMHLVFRDRTVLANPYFGTSYQEFTDFSLWERYLYDDEAFEVPYQQRTAFPVQENPALVDEIERELTRRYSYGGLENFPVKSSATALMQSMRDEVRQSSVVTVYSTLEDSDGGTEGEALLRGLAYHAFLEKFDFSKMCQGNLAERISASLAEYRSRKAFDKRYFEYLDEKQLQEILSNPVFASLQGKTLYKERTFLLGVSANEVLKLQGKTQETVVDGDEEVIFQGAIDLLAVGKDDVTVIDYKYSVKDAEYLKTKYAPQLALYRKAVSKITGVPEENVRTVIVNILRGFQVQL